MLSGQVLDRLVELRHQIHAHPEVGFQELQTRERIKKVLIEFGVKENQWREMAQTALVVNLTGLGPEKGQKRCIAFRADMDALSMVENNHHLKYKSTVKDVAHMCGHDGHVTCLIGFVPLFLPLLPKIPQNKTIRLLFQPSEQGPKSGAQLMVKQGCLDGVDEVYACHQVPSALMGELWCKQGPVTSEMTVLKIEIKGTSGHGSEPQKLKVAIWQAIQFYQKIKSFIDELKQQKPTSFICTLPVFQAGQRFDLISQTVYIEGSIRSFEQGLNDMICDKIKSLLLEIQAKGFKTDFHKHVSTPISVNSKIETGHVLKVGETVFGKDKVGEGSLPLKASDDFACFLKQRPGAYFCLSSGKSEGKPQYLHNSNFDFNDKLIPKASQFWFELAKDRLNFEQ